jgi:thiol-disulfide isomerase/thioredoxin
MNEVQNKQGTNLPRLGKASGFTKSSGEWINSEPLTLDALKGKVVLVDFWTYTCINCIRTLPHLTALYDKYKAQGLEIVGIHTPEFEFEKNYDNVKAATVKYGIKYPVVLDSNYGTWQAYGTSVTCNCIASNSNGHAFTKSVLYLFPEPKITYNHY